MTAAELRRIVGAMTERPWTLSEPPEYITSDRGQIGDTYGCRNDRSNATAITALANHADALVTLVEACERLAAYELQGMDLGVGARGAVLAMRDALAAVHAVQL